MKFRILTILLATATATIFSFKSAAPENFVVDTKASSIEWVAGKVGGSHKGTIQLASGTLSFVGKSLKSGSFGIDMSTIAISDLKGNSNQNLLNHLKSDDFFSVVKNPASTFEITKVSPAGKDRVNITGDLTIKGIKNEISFPASVKRVKNTVAAVAKGVKFDSTKYDIKYRSKNFFGDIGDNAIDDEFELSINLVAKK